MNRTIAVIGGLLAAGTPATLAADAPPPDARPNIILVLSDDVGLSRIGCYGGAPFKTPHLDRMAADGMRFERCYSMPLCGPSRSALLTGKYPFRTGATTNGNSEIDPEKNPTLPAVLRRAGYATCAIGKLGQSAPPDDPTAPGKLGFDESMLWMGRGTPDRYWNPRYFRNGTIVRGEPKDYGPDLTHAFLVDFMQRHRSRPFFVYYSAVLAHGPFARTPDSVDDSALVIDMVAYLDKLMGRLAEDLDRLQLRERTIILFTSDNGPIGDPLGTIRGRPMLGAKGDTTEGGVREPLIVNCPGLVPPGRVCDDLTDFTDFFPTLLELSRADPPGGLKLDGRSIAPQILGAPGRPRPWVYSQVGPRYFIADRCHKLYGDGTLVDITESPVTEKPVAPSDTSDAARRRLQSALDELRAGQPAEPARPPRAAQTPLKADAAPDLGADLRTLAQCKIIASPDHWTANAVEGGRVDGARAAELLIAAAAHFKPASNLQEAIAVLKAEGILSNTGHWKQNAVAGQTCTGGNMARLINKIAQRLRAGLDDKADR